MKTILQNVGYFISLTVLWANLHAIQSQMKRRKEGRNAHCAYLNTCIKKGVSQAVEKEHKSVDLYSRLAG